MNKRLGATPEDREAAVGLLWRLHALGFDFGPALSGQSLKQIADRIQKGGHDETVWVQVFVAHRLLALGRRGPAV